VAVQLQPLEELGDRASGGGGIGPSSKQTG
jgi:hypothetical protein